MPCSGLNSATSFTSFAREEQIDRRRAVARAAGVIRDQADALASQPRESSARSTSMPVRTRQRLRAAPAAVPRRAEIAAGHQSRARPALGRRVVSAAAATVATRARSGVTSPLPSGWTRFDRKTT